MIIALAGLSVIRFYRIGGTKKLEKLEYTHSVAVFDERYGRDTTFIQWRTKQNLSP